MKRNVRRDWKPTYDASMALCKYIAQGNCNQHMVEEHWHRVFCCVAKYIGFNKATRKVLWENLVAGNWERLHQTEEEGRMTADEWLEKLRGECWYCSDRYTLDRLTRCHWIYRQYMEAVRKDGVNDYAIRI